MASKVREGKTNYFQVEAKPLSAPAEVSVLQSRENKVRKATVSWNTALAGDAPVKSYEIWRDGSKIGEMPFKPQVSTDPFTWSESLGDNAPHQYMIKVTDSKGRIAESALAGIDKLV